MQIRIINPNTTASMTEAIGEAAQRVAAPGTRIVAVNPADGPASIECHFDDAVAAVGVCEEVRRGEAEGANGYVIACFGDPGLNAARELTRAPVVGIAQAAFQMAALVSARFSVVTTLARTVIIAEELLHRYGSAALCQKVRAVEIPVLELEQDIGAAVGRIIDESRRARDEDRAGAIVLGCGGMAGFEQEISQAVGLPVIEGVSAAVKLVEATVGLGLFTSKHGDLAAPPAKCFSGRFAHFSGGAA
jgi:allantoin racemase